MGKKLTIRLTVCSLIFSLILVLGRDCVLIVPDPSHCLHFPFPEAHARIVCVVQFRPCCLVTVCPSRSSFHRFLGSTSTKQGKCDLLKATTKCAPAGVRTRDPLLVFTVLKTLYTFSHGLTLRKMPNTI